MSASSDVAGGAACSRCYNKNGRFNKIVIQSNFLNIEPHVFARYCAHSMAQASTNSDCTLRQKGHISATDVVHAFRSQKRLQWFSLCAVCPIRATALYAAIFEEGGAWIGQMPANMKTLQAMLAAPHYGD